MSRSQLVKMSSKPRELGAVYTPPELVEFVVQSCVAAARWPENRPWRVLDPACGDGRFLQSVIDSVTVSAEKRLELSGVDLDGEAIATATSRLSCKASDRPEVKFRLRHGNALTGRCFGDFGDVGADPDGIDWPREFPEVRHEDGFDVVLGNPPYLREKDTARLFRGLAKSPLGRKRRQPRMDLLHYFLHRGLDLLRPNGILGFVLSSYWTAASSAERLIERLQRETTLLQIVMFGAAPLFRGVSGHHMILQLRKGVTGETCRVLDLSDGEIPGDQSLGCVISRLSLRGADREQQRPQHTLYSRNRLTIHPASAAMHSNGKCLGNSFLVRQGIAENPPFATRRMARESRDVLSPGQGVFVLTDAELQQLRPTSEERTLLRPYYATSSVGRYQLADAPTHWLLYLTRDTAGDLDAFPNVRRHLIRYRRWLERRREVRLGRIAWWHLHWPRRESLFIRPRVLAVQMGKRPSFVYVRRPTFVNFSINVISDRPNALPRCDLRVLAAILNSERASQWFKTHAKRRGVSMDISGGVLRDFPLPIVDRESCSLLSEWCDRRQQRIQEPEKRSLEARLDRLVAGLYDAS